MSGRRECLHRDPPRDSHGHCLPCRREWDREWKLARRAEQRAAAPVHGIPRDELAGVLADTGWMVDAACAGTDPEAWFPAKGANATVALRICGGCPVVLECRRLGAANRLVSGQHAYGVWGGITTKGYRTAGDAAAIFRDPAGVVA